MCQLIFFWCRRRIHITYVHILLPGEERLARGMQQESSLDEIKGIEDQEIILSVAALSHETVKSTDQAHGNIPLESLLQLEEFLESGILGQLGEVLLFGGCLSVVFMVAGSA